MVGVDVPNIVEDPPTVGNDGNLLVASNTKKLMIINKGALEEEATVQNSSCPSTTTPIIAAATANKVATPHDAGTLESPMIINEGDYCKEQTKEDDFPTDSMPLA